MLKAFNQLATMSAITLIFSVLNLGLAHGQATRQSKVYEFNTKSSEFKVALAGAIKQPGSYLIDGKTNTLAAVLKRSGGLTSSATGNLYLVRQGRTSTLILDGANSKQEVSAGDVIIALHQVDVARANDPQAKSKLAAPVELNVVLMGAYIDPVVLPIARHENNLGTLWNQILKQKPESLSKINLVHLSSPRSPVNKTMVSQADSPLMDGTIVLIPQGVFNLASVPHDLKDWLQNPDVFSKQQKQADLEETQQPAIPVSESQLADPIPTEPAIPLIPDFKGSDLPASSPTFPLEMSLPELPGGNMNSPTQENLETKPNPDNQLPVKPAEELPEIMPDNEVAKLLIPSATKEQPSKPMNPSLNDTNSASVTLRNELNRSFPELTTQKEHQVAVKVAMNDQQVIPTGLADDVGSSSSQNAPWMIDGNLKSLEPTYDERPALSPRRLSQTPHAESDVSINNEVPLPIDLDSNVGNKQASIPYLMVISSMAALFAMAMLVMSFMLSQRADVVESQPLLNPEATLNQTSEQQPKTRTTRRHLQDLIENAIPIVEEQIQFPEEVTIYNLPQNQVKLRVDQDHMPEIQDVKTTATTNVNSLDDQVLEMLNAADQVPIGKSATIYRTDKSTPGIPAPVSSSRVERALQKTQREESHS